MTVYNDLRSLIADLDRILPKSGSSPQPVALAQTRQVLERIRHYLISLQQQSLIEQIAQAAIAPIEHQLAEWIASSKAELEALQQQKQSLQQEIQELEHQRQQLISLPQRSDQHLLNLDLTFRTVFETLEKDLQGYSHSLSQGLTRMHSLGQQGEAKFLAYFNRLAQQLEQSIPKDLVEAGEASASFAPIQDEQVNTVSDLSQTEADEKIETIRSLTDLLEPEEKNGEKIYLDKWYMGIDLGTEGLSAVLLNAKEGQTYPISWSSANPQAESSFRLPATVYHNQVNEALSILATQLSLHQDHLSFLRSSSLKLSGVILSCPAFVPNTYRLPFQDAVLETKLVQETEQIFWLETAIATLLGHLDFSSSQSTTLVINAGATTTEIALVDVPDELQSLSTADFCLRSIAYGGNHLDQDILCQLLYPQWVAQLHPSLQELAGELPQPGKPDPQKRDQVSVCLQNYSLRQSFLEAAKLVKLILQEEEVFTSHLGEQPWSVKRQDLETQVIQPLIQLWNDEIDSLLVQAGKPETAITQVICSGGTTLALTRSLSPWLTNKFPHATLLQDTEEEMANNVAVGLARLPLFPNLRRFLA